MGLEQAASAAMRGMSGSVGRGADIGNALPGNALPPPGDAQLASAASPLSQLYQEVTAALSPEQAAALHMVLTGPILLQRSKPSQRQQRRNWQTC